MGRLTWGENSKTLLFGKILKKAVFCCVIKKKIFFHTIWYISVQLQVSLKLDLTYVRVLGAQDLAFYISSFKLHAHDNGNFVKIMEFLALFNYNPGY